MASAASPWRRAKKQSTTPETVWTLNHRNLGEEEDVVPEQWTGSGRRRTAIITGTERSNNIITTMDDQYITDKTDPLLTVITHTRETAELIG